MDAVYYHGVRNFEIIQTPIPDIDEDEILIKVACCGICGTDYHISQGEFITRFPIIPGHEIVGSIVRVGKSATDNFKPGDRCVVDPGITCGNCFFCRRGNTIMCQNFESLGVTVPGGFAQYVTVKSHKVFKLSLNSRLTDEEACLVEPCACAIHGLDRLDLSPGSDVLILGAGPTGLLLAQLLKLNGASRVVIAANRGPKTALAKSLRCADEFVEIDRNDAQASIKQWKTLREANPHGFDVVIEATGNEEVATRAIEYVRRGGTLMVYGVYDNQALVTWSPSRIFGEEIRIIGSFAQTHCFPRAIQYLESGKVNVSGMVTDIFTLNEFQKALDKMNSKEAVKVVVKAE